ncbi:MAG TPA: hypothetical protein VGH27_03510 [Streptosporangiaceae bacterium]|jgi:hypothetical protein
MSQTPKPPPELDPRWKNRVGVTVLERGLPPLPDVLDYSMSIPVAFWTATGNAVVLFLQFSRQPEGTFNPAVTMMGYTRTDTTWSPNRHVVGVGWSHDPIAHPRDVRDLGGRAMVTGGGGYTDNPTPGRPAAVTVGRVGPTVTQIALIQDGVEDRRILHSHFGAWVVCVERWLPYKINALDSDGNTLASISGPPRLPSQPGSSPPRAHPEADKPGTPGT